MAFDSKDFWIATGGAVAFLLGWRRLAGAVWGIGGLYEYSRGKKLAGGAAIAGGTSLLIFPDWPTSLVDYARGKAASSDNKALPVPQELQVAPYQKVSFPSLDRDLMGGWRMLDVRDIRDKGVSPIAQSLKPGQIASLVLQNKNGPYMVFNARVLQGGNGIMYAGQWATQPPSGGPQLIDFGPEHVFAVHG